MAGVPCTGLEVVGELGDAGCDEVPVEQRTARDPGSHRRIEVRLRSGPVRGEEPVLAVGGHRNRLDADAAERVVEVREGNVDELVVGQCLRQVLRGQPEVVLDGRVPGEDHDPVGDPAHLGDPRPPIGPVMDREDGERRVEGPVTERQVLGHALGSAAAPGGRWASITGDGSMRRDHRTGALVGAGAAADVHDPPGVTERCDGSVPPPADRRGG